MRAAFAVLLAALSAGWAAGLEPRELAVVANKNVPASKEVAEHYLAKRGVPAENLILLDLPAGDDISHADYVAKLAEPLKAFLRPRKEQIKAILLVYGVPLRKGADVQTAAEAAEQKTLTPKLAAAREALAAAQKATPPDPAALARLRKAADGLQAAEWELTHAESQSAVDSELMVLWFPAYPSARFVVNPLHWQYPAAKRDRAKLVLITARLDGPTPAVAKRLVDDAVAVEAAGGLKGKAYIDARGIGFDPKKPGESGTGYEGYDESFREAAAVLKKAGLDVTLDDKPELFAANSCPDAALYAGWYALADYRPCCAFNQGAVAWHLASSEAVTLKAGTKFWCPNLLEAGAAVTLGPVGEPYTVGFPKPAEFFGFLATGEYTVGECYAKTVYLASWMGTLVGDPLYNPYGKSKPGKVADVTPSPRGLPSVFR